MQAAQTFSDKEAIYKRNPKKGKMNEIDSKNTHYD